MHDDQFTLIRQARTPTRHDDTFSLDGFNSRKKDTKGRVFLEFQRSQGPYSRGVPGTKDWTFWYSFEVSADNWVRHMTRGHLSTSTHYLSEVDPTVQSMRFFN